MKRLVLSFAIFTVFQSVYSQGDSFSGILIEEPLLINNSYLHSVKDQNTPEIVKKLQLKAANYSILEPTAFGSNGFPDKKVIHLATNGYISTLYNKSGKIVTSWERFRDVPPSKNIQKLVAKKFKGWEIVGNKYISNYSAEKVLRRLYKLKLSKDGRTKKVTIDVLAL
ncbi:hypothetical protein [Ulvibacterium sp.]|uniref:hypothetical protein n=1 Tax=Ulvibacterium sp. TaxID=2665914 RepID=UPI003CC68FF9